MGHTFNLGMSFVLFGKTKSGFHKVRYGYDNVAQIFGILVLARIGQFTFDGVVGDGRFSAAHEGHHVEELLPKGGKSKRQAFDFLEGTVVFDRRHHARTAGLFFVETILFERGIVGERRVQVVHVVVEYFLVDALVDGDYDTIGIVETNVAQEGQKRPIAKFVLDKIVREHEYDSFGRA